MADPIIPNKNPSPATQKINIQLTILNGIFGELPGCDGILEEIIDTPEKLAQNGLDPKAGGTYTKVYGCSYLYKGYPAAWRIYGMEQAKSDISNIPRLIIGKSILYALAVGLRFIFQRRKFVHDLHILFEDIRHKTIRHYSPPYERYNQRAKEIARATDAAVKAVFKVDETRKLVTNDYDAKDTKWQPIELPIVITKVVAFICLIIDSDGAYGFRLGDGFNELDKENARRSGPAEFFRIIDILIERETALGVPGKWKMIKLGFRGMFLFMPKMRQFMQIFLLELDKNKVGLDEAERYFVLRRDSYNFMGLSLNERLKKLDEIDKEKGHWYIPIKYETTGGNIHADIKVPVEVRDKMVEQSKK